jgi:hypothetical protein
MAVGRGAKNWRRHLHPESDCDNTHHDARFHPHTCLCSPKGNRWATFDPRRNGRFRSARSESVRIRAQSVHFLAHVHTLSIEHRLVVGSGSGQKSQIGGATRPCVPTASCPLRAESRRLIAEQVAHARPLRNQAPAAQGLDAKDGLQSKFGLRPGGSEEGRSHWQNATLMEGSRHRMSARSGCVLARISS